MKHHPKLLKSIALSALASVFLCGSALAVPTPTYPSLDPGSDATMKVVSPAAVTTAPGALIVQRTGNLSPARGNYLRTGGVSLASSAPSISTTTRSRSKARYLMPSMVLAALTPLALHYASNRGDNSAAVQTQTPTGAGSSLANLGDAISGGHGKGHERGDGEGDNGDSGGEVSDSGDSSGSGDQGDAADTGDNGGGDDHGNGGGGTTLPEPGTVPLVGAGLMMALVFRSRRER